MSDQLFWIIAVLLVVEILSQLFQFETMGKVFVQFYVLIVHALIGVTLATFETRELVWYFVVLITFINGLRYLLYKIPAVESGGGARFVLDLVMVGALIGLMWGIDPFLNFQDVPTYSLVTQVSILASLGMSLLFEMVQRAQGVGINLDDFLPRTKVSFLTVFLVLATGIALIASPWFDLNIALRFQILFGFVLGILFIRLLSYRWARDPEFYDILYVVPSLVTIVVFVQLIILG